MLAKITEVRTKLHETCRKVALAFMTMPRYRNLPIGELNTLILDPLMRLPLAIATSGKDGTPTEGSLSGIAIWASVSPEVDAKIREQIKAGTFLIRLQAEDWNSGDINWLLDVLLPAWPSALRRAFAAISASAKNGRRACAQQADPV